MKDDPSFEEFGDSRCNGTTLKCVHPDNEVTDNDDIIITNDWLFVIKFV